MNKLAPLVLSSAILALSLGSTSQAQVWDDATMTFLHECEDNNQNYVRKIKDVRYCGPLFENDANANNSRGRGRGGRGLN